MMTSQENHVGTRKIWVSSTALEALTRALATELDKSPDETTVRAIHDELAVARQRFLSVTDSPNEVARALGHPEGSVPLALNLVEASVLCSLASVPVEVRQVIMRGLA